MKEICCPRCGAALELEFEDGFSHCPECGCEIEDSEQNLRERVKLASSFFEQMAVLGAIEPYATRFPFRLRVPGNTWNKLSRFNKQLMEGKKL